VRQPKNQTVPVGSSVTFHCTGHSRVSLHDLATRVLVVVVVVDVVVVVVVVVLVVVKIHNLNVSSFYRSSRPNKNNINLRII